MDRAMQLALERCPKSDDVVVEARRAIKREIFCQGYAAAENTLTLTWEDVKKVEDLCMEVATLFASVGRNKVILEPPFYEEVARRFNSQKEKK